MTRVRHHPLRTKHGVTVRREHERHVGVKWTSPSGDAVTYVPKAGEEEMVEKFTAFFEGRAKDNSGIRVQVPNEWVGFGGMRLAQSEEMRGEMTRLRTILEHEITGLEGSALIATMGWRGIEISGYPKDAYSGSIWQVDLTPPFVMENQHQIVEYLRAHEDQIVETIQRLAARKRSMGGRSVKFWEQHPGLHDVRYAEGPDGRYIGVEFNSERTGKPVRVLYGSTHEVPI